jgi:hypothetical protein
MTALLAEPACARAQVDDGALDVSERGQDAAQLDRRVEGRVQDAGPRVLMAGVLEVLSLPIPVRDGHRRRSSPAHQAVPPGLRLVPQASGARGRRGWRFTRVGGVALVLL